MKVAHVVKRIEMIDDDVKQLKKLENQLKKGKKYSTPIMISIEKQINILLAERIKYLELRIENAPEFAQWEEEENTAKSSAQTKPEKVSRIRTRKKTGAEAKSGSGDTSKKSSPKAARSAQSSDIDNEEDNDINSTDASSLMLTQEMIDKKFEETRKRLMEETDDDASQQEKKKGIGGNY